jgi:hypothetical protein
MTLPVLKVVAPEARKPAAYAPATQGLRLFTVKGCVGCHTHIEAAPEKSAVAARMDLTGMRFDSKYLRDFLANPGIKTTDMPNLKLSKEEVELLAVFLNKDFKKQKQDAIKP